MPTINGGFTPAAALGSLANSLANGEQLLSQNGPNGAISIPNVTLDYVLRTTTFGTNFQSAQAVFPLFNFSGEFNKRTGKVTFHTVTSAGLALRTWLENCSWAPYCSFQKGAVILDVQALQVQCEICPKDMPEPIRDLLTFVNSGTVELEPGVIELFRDILASSNALDLWSTMFLGSYLQAAQLPSVATDADWANTGVTADQRTAWLAQHASFTGLLRNLRANAAIHNTRIPVTGYPAGSSVATLVRQMYRDLAAKVPNLNSGGLMKSDGTPLIAGVTLDTALFARLVDEADAQLAVTATTGNPIKLVYGPSTNINGIEIQGNPIGVIVDNRIRVNCYTMSNHLAGFVAASKVPQFAIAAVESSIFAFTSYGVMPTGNEGSESPLIIYPPGNRGNQKTWQMESQFLLGVHIVPEMVVASCSLLTNI